MKNDPNHTELLFSYGTLQLESVQQASFGRLLFGTADVLTGYELLDLKIQDQSVIEISGKDVHTMAAFTGRDTDTIPGTAYAVSPEEIQKADQYEVPAVTRIAVTLQSGAQAWVYVDARSAPMEGT